MFRNKGYRCAVQNLQLVQSTHRRVCLWKIPLNKCKFKTKIFNNIESLPNVYNPQALLSAGKEHDIPAVVSSIVRSPLTQEMCTHLF